MPAGSNRALLTRLHVPAAHALLLVGVGLIGCSSSHPARVVSPTGEVVADPPPKTRDKEVVVQHLRRDAASSHHFVNLIGAEEPHVHDRSDLTVFVLKGAVRMHFEDHEVDVGPGDVVDIPMGAFHWAENIDSEPSLAYVIYAPAFDGKDRRAVQPRARGMTPKILPSGAH